MIQAILEISNKKKLFPMKQKATSNKLDTFLSNDHKLGPDGIHSQNQFAAVISCV
jgi:hypothetical protein